MKKGETIAHEDVRENEADKVGCFLMEDRRLSKASESFDIYCNYWFLSRYFSLMRSISVVRMTFKRKKQTVCRVAIIYYFEANSIWLIIHKTRIPLLKYTESEEFNSQNWQSSFVQ